MADRTHSLATWLFAGLTLFPFHFLAGQEQKYLGDVRKSFAGFSWGTTQEEITAARGRPAKDTLVRDFRRLVYQDTVEAKPVDVWYMLHPTRGLMAGQVGFQKPDEKCQDGFKQIRQAVERANPGLEKRNEQKRELDVVCSMEFGARIGSWQLAWGDSGSARISEMMLSGSPRILVYYRGPDADAYVAEQVARRGPAIEGFGSFAWGTPRNSIIKRLGVPKRTDSTSSTVSLSYLDLLLGERAVLEFTTSPIEGLIKGTYWVPVPTGYDCDLFYRKFYFALIERFPDITPSVIRFNRSGKSFCEGVAKGNAAVTSVWRDPKSEAFVTAELNQPGKMVKISYLGSTYQTWSKRNREADLKGKL
jgi:hypothetical protein